MASTFSTNLAIELIGTGDQAGTWGTTTNSNLGTLIEQAISGYVTQAVATGTDTTITIPNGATGVARNMYIELTGTGGTNTNLIVPANKKLYFIFNNSTGAVTVKVSGQTGVSVPTGKKMVLVSNGTDIVNGLNYIADFGTNSFSVTNLTASSGTITNLIATSGSITNLVSSDASATVLRAGSATLTHLSATSATITNLTLTSLVISNLSIASANITTLTGSTQTLSGNLTLSGGTANGVLYLNGSKVATSGTALVFDGTNLGIGGSGDPFGRFYGRSVGLTSASSAALEINSATGSTSAIDLGVNSSRTAGITSNTTETNLTTLTATPLLFGTNGSERMRLDSSGNLGIGTASPGNRVTISDPGTGLGFSNAASGNFNIGLLAGTGSALAYVYQRANSDLLFGTNNTERMRLDSSGNLGIGASPAASNFSGSYTSLLVKGNSANKIGTVIAQSFGTANATNIEMFAADGSNEAGLLVKGASTAMTFYTGSVPDKRMTLDSSGNLGLGVTPSAWGTASRKVFQIGTGGTGNVHFAGGATTTVLSSNYYFNGTNSIYINSGAAQAYVQASDGSHQWLTAASGTAGNAISFTQAMTLDASGNLLVGTTSSLYSTAGRGVLEVNGSSSSLIACKVNNAAAGYLFHSGTDLLLVNAVSGALRFDTNNTERARITSGGDLLVGTSSGTDGRVKVDGTSNAAGVAFWGKNSGAAVSPTHVMWNNSASGDNKFIDFYTEASATLRGSIDYNRAGGLVRYNTTSDYRAKDILGPVQNSGATIDALKVYEGVMKGATQSRPMLIAHEAQEYAPYAVSGVKDEVKEDGTPKYQQIDVSAFVPLLLAELQSLRKRVAELESK